MAKHVNYIPDCPECGAECRQMGVCDVADWGISRRLWACPECGWESEHVEGYSAFAELTEKLTEHMRGDEQ